MKTPVSNSHLILLPIAAERITITPYRFIGRGVLQQVIASFIGERV